MSLDALARKLSDMPFFAGMEQARLKLLIVASRRVQFRQGQTICKQGDMGDRAFVILSGKADVLIEHGDQPVRVASVVENDIIGEIAIVCDTPRTATIRVASEIMETLEISKSDFLTMIQDFPDMGLKVTEYLAIRLVKANQELAEMRESLNA